MKTTGYLKEITPDEGFSVFVPFSDTHILDKQAVKHDGYALKFVKDQTPEICLEAVKQNGYALKFVNKNCFD